MRITLRIVSAGDFWSFAVPMVSLSRCYPPDESGNETFYEDEFRREVMNSREVQIGSDDRGPVCAFAALLLSSLGEWLDDNAKSWSDAKDRAERRISARSKRGSCSFVRIDMSNVTVSVGKKVMRTVKVRIRNDDNGVVSAERFDRSCALIVADFCTQYSRRFVSKGDPPLVFDDSVNELVEELHEIRSRNDLRKMAESCERNMSGYCSPAKFDCPNYDCGRCKFERNDK